MKRILTVLTVALLAVAMMLVMTAPAFAASFGPGSSDKGPKDPAAKCHPPGQTVTTPGCK